MQKVQLFIKRYPFVAATIVVALVAGVIQITGYGLAAQIIITIFALGVAGKLAIGMVNDLRHGHYGVDILAILAIGSTLAVGEVWATIVIVLMLTGGEALEDFAAARAKKELTALLKQAPQTAHKITHGDHHVTVKLSEIVVGDKLYVKPGEVLPVDSQLISPAAELDESSLTGESLPVTYKKGDSLMSGTINGSAAITIRALKTAKNSQFQQIIKLVAAAADLQAPFVRLADRYAVPFTIIAVGIAILSWWLSGNLVRAAEVLVVATPCPLLIGAPTAFISGMSRAAKNGIIIKSGSTLERLATIRAVAFDKTGTLTCGIPAIESIDAVKGHSQHDVLLYAASAEHHSVHILAKAIVEKAKSQRLTLKTAKDARETIAEGISAVIDGQEVLVGKHGFLKNAGVSIKSAALKAGETAVYVAVDSTYIGSITFTDQIRPESKSTIQSLQSNGVDHTVMLTGDSTGTARRIAHAIGITDFQAECLPLDKVRAIQQLPFRPVMMVGDGVNDAPVLAAADVGMAMGARGSTAASETADVVVLVDDISKSAQAIAIAKHTLAVALQSVWIGIVVSIILMIIAMTGIIPAIVGALLQEVVDVVVIINALRAHGRW